MSPGETCIVLVNSFYGAELWRDVEPELRRAFNDSISIVLFSPPLIHRTDSRVIGMAALRQLRSDLTRDDRTILAVGYESGAAPASAMVDHQDAAAALLIDGDLRDLDGSLTTYQDFVPSEPHHIAEEMGRRLTEYVDQMPTRDPSPMTPELIDISHGAFTGDPVRMRLAELDKVEFDRRYPVDGSADIGDAPDLYLLPRLNNPKLDVTMQFSKPYERLFKHLAPKSPPGRLVQTEWPLHPVVSAPKGVAAAIADWASPRVQ